MEKNSKETYTYLKFGATSLYLLLLPLVRIQFHYFTRMIPEKLPNLVRFFHGVFFWQPAAAINKLKLTIFIHSVIQLFSTRSLSSRSGNLKIDCFQLRFVEDVCKSLYTIEKKTSTLQFVDCSCWLPEKNAMEKSNQIRHFFLSFVKQRN